jgi:hypothetical protein
VRQQLLEAAAGTAKSLSVPIGVIGGNLLLGINWQPWVYVATVAWLVLQSAKLLWDWIVHPAIKRRRK